MKTYTPKKSEIERSWFVVDAEGMVLGRLATEVARILRGKHKPTFTPNLDVGDHVIIINASKIVLTANKAATKRVWRHSGFPGGIKSMSYQELLDKKPADALRKSIGGMLPKTRLGAQQLTKLKVYPGAEHPHGPQKPEPLVFENAKAKV